MARAAICVVKHEKGPVKVGISNKPKDRVEQMQTHCPYEINLEHRIAFRTRGGAIRKKSNNAEDIEWELHKWLQQWKMHGEWFDLPIAVEKELLNLDTLPVDPQEASEAIGEML